MSDYYARPRPALGFDPAPGDVGIMRSLARRQHAAAEEFRQVKQQVQNADLSSWQGQAGSVARPMANQLASALGYAASAADRVGMVSQTWAGQLATFQAEADALEKQAAAAAADQEYLTGKQATLAAMTGPVDRAADLEAAQARVNQIQARARQLHQDYETSAAQLARQLDAPTAWERTEPDRKALEWLLAQGGRPQPRRTGRGFRQGPRRSRAAHQRRQAGAGCPDQGRVQRGHRDRAGGCVGCLRA
jgi:hypothetical protein